MMNRLHLVWLVTICLIGPFMSSCSKDPFFYQNGFYSDKDKEVRVSVILRTKGNGSLLIQVHPSYTAFSAGRNIPVVVNNLSISWVQKGSYRRIIDAQGKPLALVEKGGENESVLIFERLPPFLLKKEYGAIPLRYELAPVGRSKS